MGFDKQSKSLIRKWSRVFVDPSVGQISDCVSIDAE